MFGKTSGHLLLLVLLLDPSSVLLADKRSNSGQLEKLLKQSKGSQQLVLKAYLEAARALLGIYQENPDLAKEYPSMKELEKQLDQQGRIAKSMTAANRAYFYATVYMGLVSLIIEGEIKPILDHIEMMLLNGGEENALKTNGDAELMNAMKMLKKGNVRIQDTVHNIKDLETRSIEGKKQSGLYHKALVFCSVAFLAAAVAGIPIRVWMIVPPYVVGAVTIAFGLVGYHYGERVEAYEEALKLLKNIQDKASEAEDEITKLQTKVESLALPKYTVNNRKRQHIQLQPRDEKEPVIGKEKVSVRTEL